MKEKHGNVPKRPIYTVINCSISQITEKNLLHTHFYKHLLPRHVPLCWKLHPTHISSGIKRIVSTPFPYNTSHFLNLIRGGNNTSPTGINFMLIIYVRDSHSCSREARVLQISCFLIWGRCGMGQKQRQSWTHIMFLDLLISLAVSFYHFIRRWFGA